MRRVGVVTTARSDYSILEPVLREIVSRPGLELHLIAAAMHLLPEFGNTIQAIERDGFHVEDRIDMLLASDSAQGIATSMGIGMIGFAYAYARTPLDLLLVLGDRFEMLSAVAAALPFRIPVAHIAGGELTEGAVDDCIRHAISKMSHLHFVSTQNSRNRLVQMGEEPWRAVVTGSPSVDQALSVPALSREQVALRIGLDLEPPPLLVTLHPETQSTACPEAQIVSLLTALEAFPTFPIVFTAPNADLGHAIFLQHISQWVKTHSNARLVPSLGIELYFSLLRVAAALVGNSSSGVVEAPSFQLPVVNIGRRQHGRLHAHHIISVDFDADAIRQAIDTACTATFRAGLRGLQNPFGDGRARVRIVDHLQSVELGHGLLVKRFQVPSPGAEVAVVAGVPDAV